RLGGRFQVRRQARHLEGRDQRRGEARRRAAAQGHSRLHRSAQRLDRLQPRSAFLGLPHGSDQGDRRHAGARDVVVRQRVGLLQSDGRYRSCDGQARLSLPSCASATSTTPTSRANASSSGSTSTFPCTTAKWRAVRASGGEGGAAPPTGVTPPPPPKPPPRGERVSPPPHPAGQKGRDPKESLR